MTLETYKQKHELVQTLRQNQDRILELNRALESTFGIECGLCAVNVAVESVSQWQAATQLDAAGWRMVTDEPRCPECVSNLERGSGLQTPNVEQPGQASEL